MPFISVIVPTYNRCLYLQKTVQSILNQTMDDFELIIVNDGSNDTTKEYLQSLVDKRVLCIHVSQNRGGNYARNAALKLSTGMYIAFCDDDDEWEPDKLRKQVTFMKAHGCALSYCGVTIYSHKGKKIKYVFHKPLFRSKHLKSIMIRNYIGITSSIIVMRSWIEKIQGFDESMPALQDYDFYIRLISQGGYVEGLNEPLVRYNIILEQLSVSRNSELIHRAAQMLLSKYKTSPYRGYLTLCMGWILVKRMVLSRKFFVGTIVFLAKKIKTKCRKNHSC